MSIHPDMIRAMLAHGGDLQEAYAAAMKASVSPHLRKGGAMKLPDGTASKDAGSRGGKVAHRAVRGRAADRHKEIMALADAGVASAAIARQLGLPARTVSDYVRAQRVAAPTPEGDYELLMLSDRLGDARIRAIAARVCASRGVCLVRVMGKSRDASLAAARAEICFEASEQGMKSHEIAETLGRQSSTVRHFIITERHRRGKA